MNQALSVSTRHFQNRASIDAIFLYSNWKAVSVMSGLRACVSSITIGRWRLLPSAQRRQIQPVKSLESERLIKSQLQNEAEVAAVVSDSFQRQGIGRALVDRLLTFAKDEKLALLRASVLTENLAMRKLLESKGFEFHEGNDPEVLEGELSLKG
jgi:GNAT superfamily N-acetyltransferase